MRELLRDWSVELVDKGPVVGAREEVQMTATL
jgi:hypothetical protein